MITKINFLLSKNDKLNIFYMLLGLLLIGFFELISIGSIPFIVSYIFSNENSINFIIFENYFNEFQNEEILIFLSIVILILFISKNFFIIIYNYFENIVLRNLSVNLGSKIYSNYLTFDYLNLKKKNSSEIAKNVTHNVESVRNIIGHLLKLLKEFIVCVVISALLIYHNYKVSIFLIILFTILVLLFYKVFSSTLYIRGKKLQNLTGLVLKNLTQTFSSIKLIFILNKQNNFYENFNKINKEKYKHTFFQRYISTLPRIFFETILVVIFCCIPIYYLYNNYEISELLAFISLIIVSGLRLLPSFSIFSTSTTSIKFSLSSINILFDDFKNNRIELNNNNRNKEDLIDIIENEKPSLFLSNITFQHRNTQEKLFENLHLDINKNCIVGIFGKSGAGKTTLVEIILGLINPNKGVIKYKDVDVIKYRKFWNKKVGYVPQDIFLLDDTIINNITLEFNPKKIDKLKFENSIKLSQLEDFIHSLPNREYTYVGERGAEISGGQMQRMAIARALYHEFEVLIMDEATNALDKYNTQKIFDCLNNLKNRNKIILLISHDKQILNSCDFIYKLENKILIKV